MARTGDYILVLVSLVAAGLMLRHRARHREGNQDKAQVHSWENEGGNAVDLSSSVRAGPRDQDGP